MRIVSLILLWLGLAAWAQADDAAQTLDDLLAKVRSAGEVQRAEDAQRLAVFEAQHAERQALLKEAKAQLAAVKAEHAELQKQFDAQAGKLSTQQTELSERSGDFLPVFELLRRMATEVRADLDKSLINAEYPQHAQALAALSDGEGVPSLAQVRGLWQSLLADMVASGEVKRFPATVISLDGEAEQTEVLRVGAFTAVNLRGQFLRYVPESGHFVVLGKQPAARYQQMAQDLAQAQSGWLPMAIDPSQGELLSLLVETPDWRERLQQGGWIAYVILVLGAVGLLLVLERLVSLSILRKRMGRQLREPQQIKLDNPLGRVLQVYAAQPDRDTETLSLKLDEAVLRELPVLKRSLGSLGVLAGLSPLLGLLGTVTGIIHTFQTMAVLGAGDPKLMSGGISEALITTELGLIVAIPLLLLHSLLSSMSNRLVHVLDEQSAALVARQAEVHHPVEISAMR